MSKNRPIERHLLDKNVSSSYENEIKKQAEQEMLAARKEKEEKEKNKDKYLVETNINKISDKERFDKNTIYKVFNRKQKTETFVNGEQAENLVKYTDDYVVMFDHRIIY